MVRTNCNNCGAPIPESGRCPYCKTEWFRSGFQLGKHAYVGETKLTRYAISGHNAGRDAQGRMHMDILRYENKVELSIIGMTDDEVGELMKAITGVRWSL